MPGPRAPGSSSDLGCVRWAGEERGKAVGEAGGGEGERGGVGKGSARSTEGRLLCLDANGTWGTVSAS